jgi:hypothetical protein
MDLSSLNNLILDYLIFYFMDFFHYNYCVCRSLYTLALTQSKELEGFYGECS